MNLLPHITLQQVSRHCETQGTNDDPPAAKRIEEQDRSKTTIQENSNVARTSKAQYCGMFVSLNVIESPACFESFNFEKRCSN